MNTFIQGYAHKFGDDINTDLISPAQYMELSLAEMAAHAMEGADPDFAVKMRKGDIIVAGKNFGSGSSRETAPLALLGAGVALIVAESFARIFYRNCINTGLPVLICPTAGQIAEGDLLAVDLAQGKIRDLSNGSEHAADQLPPHLLRLLSHGGLLGDLQQRLNHKEADPCTRK